MKKSGGGITLTKVHNPENMREKEVNHIEGVVPRFIENKNPTIWDATLGVERHNRLKAKLVVKRPDSASPSGRLSSIAPQLFNLDPCSRPERPQGVRLGLYQMENL